MLLLLMQIGRVLATAHPLIAGDLALEFGEHYVLPESIAFFHSCYVEH